VTTKIFAFLLQFGIEESLSHLLGLAPSITGYRATGFFLGKSHFTSVPTSVTKDLPIVKMVLNARYFNIEFKF
jgi:hypothetical protein